MLLPLHQRPMRLLALALVVLLGLSAAGYVRRVDLAACSVAALRSGDADHAGSYGTSRLLSARPAAVPPGPPTRVAKVGVAVDALDIPVIHRAFGTHQVHNDRHGYLHYIADKEVVDALIDNDMYHRGSGAYTKPAYLLSIVIAELLKPEEERLEWLFWFDGDTVITNPSMPLEIFLPPDTTDVLREIHLLIAANWDGLNSGAFAVRVCRWTASFLAAVLAYPMYERERTLQDRFRDQSAIQFLLTDPDSPLARERYRSHDHWAEVPMRWFNALPVNNAFYGDGRWIFGKEMTDKTFDEGTARVLDDGGGGAVQPWKVMRGDLMVHFAGTKAVRDSWMTPWLDRAEQLLPAWDNATRADELRRETATWWEAYDQNAVALYMKPIPPPADDKPRAETDKASVTQALRSSRAESTRTFFSSSSSPSQPSQPSSSSSPPQPTS